MVGKEWPTGISPNGSGIRIRIWKDKRVVYDETVEGNIYSQADLAAAVKRREHFVSRMKLGLPLFEGGQSKTQLFSVVAQDYLNTLECDHSTLDSYTNALNLYWMPPFGNWIISDVTTRHIKTELSKLKNLSQKTRKNIMVPLRGVFAHAMDSSLVKANPVAAVKLKKHQKPPIDRFTPKERGLVLEKLDGISRVYFAVLFGCGLRPGGEPMGLRWKDYDGQNLRVHQQIVRRQKKKTTKTHESRLVYVPTWVREILESHPGRGLNEFIFTNTRGEHYRDTDYFNAHWKEALKAARIPYRVPYVCRHTRASEMLSMGVEPGRAAKQLGHTLEMFYRTYAEWIEEFSGSTDFEKLEGKRLETA